MMLCYFGILTFSIPRNYRIRLDGNVGGFVDFVLIVLLLLFVLLLVLLLVVGAVVSTFLAGLKK